MRCFIFGLFSLSMICSSCTKVEKAYIFDSSGGGMELKLDITNRRFAIINSHDTSLEYQNIEDCSDITDICYEGPFSLKLTKAKFRHYASIGQSVSVSSSNDMRICEFDLIPKSKSEFYIQSFECRFSSKMPWPKFIARSEAPTLSEEGIQ